MWPEEGNISDVARRGYNKGCGQKRVIQLMWQEQGNTNDDVRIG